MWYILCTQLPHNPAALLIQFSIAFILILQIWTVNKTRGKVCLSRDKVIFLFCDIYDWAGQIRDINLSKKGTDFVSADQIDACAKSCFQRLQSFHAEELSQRELAEEVADFYHTINMLHPFREGNGRVQRAFFEYWVEERLGCSLNLTAVDADEFMIATILAAQGIMDQLIHCFETMLQPLEMDMGMHMF